MGPTEEEEGIRRGPTRNRWTEESGEKLWIFDTDQVAHHPVCHGPRLQSYQITVRSSLGELIYSEPKWEFLAKYYVRTMNSVHYVVPDRPFEKLVRNFSASDGFIPNEIIICYATWSPLSLVSLTIPWS